VAEGVALVRRPGGIIPVAPYTPSAAWEIYPYHQRMQDQQDAEQMGVSYDEVYKLRSDQREFEHRQARDVEIQKMRERVPYRPKD
jgi:hypothetical protein